MTDDRKYLGVRWFNTIGIVRADVPYTGIMYYIGLIYGQNELEDIQYIMRWGSKFPTDAGDVLFGVADDCDCSKIDLG